MLAIVHIEDVFDFEDISFGESWLLVGSCIKFRFDSLCFFASAHIFSINNKNVNQVKLSLFHLEDLTPISEIPSLCIFTSFGLNPGSVIVKFSTRLKSDMLT